MVRELVDYAPSPGARGVGACARLLPTKSDPRETSGPQIDRIPSTRPSWRDRQYRELKKKKNRPPVSAQLISLDANVHIVLQKQLGSGERRADIRVDAPQQVLALRRVLMGPEMPDAVRGPRVDD